MKLRRVVAVLALATAGTIGAFTLTGSANAALTATDLPGNVTVLNNQPRLEAYNSANTSYTAGQARTYTIAGNYGVPNNATGVQFTITADATGANGGGVTVYPSDVARPGTASEYINTSTYTNETVTVPLSADGKITIVTDVKATVNTEINAYYVNATCAPQTYTIDPSSKTLAHIGPSVRTDNTTPGSGVTDLGTVTLPAGTYDTRVTGGFSGLKNTTNVPATTTLLGGLFLTNGTAIPSGFGSVLAQEQGVEIPRTNSGSASYTVDPTIQVDTFLNLKTSTAVHVQAYAYSSDGSDRGAQDSNPSGVTANVQSATFRSVC